MSDEEKKEDSGSVWTSYSDLFMSVSIVFIVMFIFSILQSSVSIMKSENAKDEKEKYAEGLVPEKVQKENKLNREKAKETLIDLKSNSKEVKESLENLTELTKNITERQSFINKILDDQVEKSSMLALAQKKIEKNRESIENKEIQIKDLNGEISDLGEQLSGKIQYVKQVDDRLEFMEEEANYYKENFQVTSQELGQKIKELKEEETSNQKLEARLSTLEQQQNKLEDDLKLRNQNISNKENEIRKLTKEFQKLGKEYKNQTKALDKTSRKNEKLKVYEKKYNEVSADLKSKIKNLESLRDNLKRSEKQFKDQSLIVGRLDKMNLSYKETISQMKNEMASLEKTNSALDQQKKRFSEQLQKQKNQIADYKKDLKVKKDAVEECISNALDQKKKYTNRLSKCDHKISDLSSRITKQKNTVSRIKAEKEKFGDKYRVALANLSAVEKILDRGIYVDLEVDEDKTSITLKQRIIFHNNSSQLLDTSKDLIRNKFIPVADEITKEGVYIHLVEFNIMGHSSPVYRGAFVMNMDMESQPYKYNMELSKKRAIGTSDFILGKEIGKYHMKKKLKTLLRVESYGYLEPVLKDNNENYGLCGRYDCEKSRRIEINIVLKNHE